MISIIIPSNRIGGLDILAASLRAQSSQDFELILVDELRSHRRHTVPQLGKGGSWHVGTGQIERWGTYMASLNRGLELSRGDVLLFISDYTFLHPNCIAEHAAFHSTHAKTDVALGSIDYTALPKLHPDFPLEYGWAKIGHDPANYSDETYAPWLDFKRRHELYEEFRTAYERDLDNGRLAPFMTSVFAEPFTSVDGLKVWQTNDRGPPSQFMNLKNDSVRRELLDGFRFDERADGTHGHQDSITHRQLAKRGAAFHPIGARVSNLDPHPVAIIRRAGLNDETNLKLAEAAQ